MFPFMAISGQHILHSGVQLAGLKSRAYDAPKLQHLKTCGLRAQLTSLELLIHKLFSAWGGLLKKDGPADKLWVSALCELCVFACK